MEDSLIYKEINNIKLNYDDLIEIAVNFITVYEEDNPETERSIEKSLENEVFLDYLVSTAREVVVLSTLAVILDETIDFNNVLDQCINKEQNKKYFIDTLVLGTISDSELKMFIYEFKTFLSSKIFSNNLDLKRITELNKKIINTRYDSYSKRIENEF